MNRVELVNAIAKKAELSKTKAAETLNIAIETIKGSLKKGNRVQLIGFGTFLVRQRKARQGRNPKTGETLQIKARKVPAFKAGSEFKNSLR